MDAEIELVMGEVLRSRDADALVDLLCALYLQAPRVGMPRTLQAWLMTHRTEWWKRYIQAWHAAVPGSSQPGFWTAPQG